MIDSTTKQVILDKISEIQLSTEELRLLAESLPAEEPPVDPPDEPELPPLEPVGSLWSDPASWPNGVPTAETDVTIHGDMVIDGVANCRTLSIQGPSIVTLAGHLHAHGSVIVEDDATLQGTAGTISFYVPDERVFVGAHGHMPDPQDIGLWMMPGSTTDFCGEAKTPWLSTIPSTAGTTLLKYGASSRKTMVPGQWGAVNPDVENPGFLSTTVAPNNWNDGDLLLLTNEHGEARLARQVHRHAYHINHDQGDFEGGNLIYDGVVRGSAKVANLTRSITIESALCVPGDTNHRAHTIALRGANIRFENVAFRNMGPRGKQGLYPIHIHHGLGETPAIVRNCAIYQDCGEPGNRWAVIHDSEGVQMTGNVGYLSRGHGFFMESGTERNCTVTGNLGVHAEGKEEIPVFSPSSTSRVALGHAFWMWAGNVVGGNVSVSRDGIGMVMFGQAISPAPAPPQALIDGHEHYGGHNGAWVSKDGRISGLVSINADKGTNPGSPAGFQYIDHAFIYGTAGLSGYAYSGHRVTDSTILCDTLVSTQGATLVEVSDSVCRGEFIHACDWLKMGVIFKRCDMNLSRGAIKSKSFPDDLQYYALIRLAGCTATVAGEQLTSADFTYVNSHRAYGFEGRPIGEGIGLLLDNRAPVPGFITVSPTWKGYVRFTPVGHEPKTRVLRHSMGTRSLPESQEMGLDGYWGGLPPGDWHVEVWSGVADETPVVDEVVTVVAGETHIIRSGL